MHISDISSIGWLHTVGCIAALVFGGWNIVAVKGTRHHKIRGAGYVVSMLVAMGLSFFLYEFDIPFVRGERPGPGVFGFFHWLSIAAIAFTLLGYFAASRQSRSFWAYAHPVFMTLSYYLLIGGLVNEPLARVYVLRPFAFNIVKGHPVFPGRAVDLTQTAVDIVAIVLIIFFSIKVRRHRRHSHALPAGRSAGSVSGKASVG